MKIGDLRGWVIGVWVGIFLAAGPLTEGFAKEKNDWDVLKKPSPERIAYLKKLKQENPDEFNKLMSERKKKIDEQMKELKKKDPQKYQEIMRNMQQRQNAELKRLRQENPEQFYKIMENKRQGLLELEKNDPKKFEELIKANPKLKERLKNRWDRPSEDPGLHTGDKLGVRDHGEGSVSI